MFMDKINDVSHGAKTKVSLYETLACIDIGTETNTVTHLHLEWLTKC